MTAAYGYGINRYQGRGARNGARFHGRYTVAKAVEDIEGQAPATTDAADAPTEKTDLADMDPNATVQLMVTLPAALKLKALAAAEDKEHTLSRYVRELIADELDFTLPDSVRTRSRTYATKEEAAAAQKAKSAKRNALIKKLLQAYKAGDIDLDALDDEDDDDE